MYKFNSSCSFYVIFLKNYSLLLLKVFTVFLFCFRVKHFHLILLFVLFKINIVLFLYLLLFFILQCNLSCKRVSNAILKFFYAYLYLCCTM